MATPSFGVDDYACAGASPPYCSACAGSGVDSCGQCTSFVNWRLRQGGLPPLGGNADEFVSSARALGWTADHSFRPYDIFMYPPGCYGAGDVGHTGIVLAVSGNQIHNEQYNFCTDWAGSCNCLSGWCRYSQQTVTLSGCGAWAIHPPWTFGPPPPPPDPCSGVACPACQTCQGGTCVPVACPACEVCQGGTCVAVACPTCQVCSGGVCLPITCAPGQVCDPATGLCTSLPGPAGSSSTALLVLAALAGMGGVAGYALSRQPGGLRAVAATSQRVEREVETFLRPADIPALGGRAVPLGRPAPPRRPGPPIPAQRRPARRAAPPERVEAF